MKNSIRLNITLPRDLRSVMKHHDKNWSAIAADAFQAVLRAEGPVSELIRLRQENKELKALITQLHLMTRQS